MNNMKKYTIITILLCFCINLIACSSTKDYPLIECSSTKDYPAAIMVEETTYLLSSQPIVGEIDESAIIGYTKSYIDTFPRKDGETNFNRELNMPYAKVENGIAILYNNEWYFCTPRE